MIGTAAEKTFRRTQFVLALGLCSTTGLFQETALADVTAVFNTGEQQQITIEYKDDNHVRMSAPGGGYMIITDGEGYVASRNGNNWTVFGIEDIAAMMSRMGAGMSAMGFGGGKVNVLEVEGTTEIRNTGRKETVAGISGEVHEVTSTSNGRTEVTEIVLSDHADAVQAYQGFTRITAMMGEMAGIQDFGTVMENTYGIAGQAVLRVDDDWDLANIADGDIPDSNFALPAQPMVMPRIPGFGGD